MLVKYWIQPGKKVSNANQLSTINCWMSAHQKTILNLVSLRHKWNRSKSNPNIMMARYRVLPSILRHICNLQIHLYGSHITTHGQVRISKNEPVLLDQVFLLGKVFYRAWYFTGPVILLGLLFCWACYFTGPVILLGLLFCWACYFKIEAETR